MSRIAALLAASLLLAGCVLTVRDWRPYLELENGHELSVDVDGDLDGIDGFIVEWTIPI